MAKSMQTHLKEYEQMILMLDEVMPNLAQILGSKNASDVLETIKLTLYLYKNNIDSALTCIKKMAVLIWSKEKSVKEELIKAYWVLYLDDKTMDSIDIAKNLI